MKIIQVLVVVTLSLSSFSYGKESIKTTLFDWNEGQGKSWLGWTWSDNASNYGQPGWTLDIDPNGPLGGGDHYSIGQTRSFNKTGRAGVEGQEGTGVIDTTDRAPSTTSGGSLKVFDPQNSNKNRATWWVWYDGKPLGDRGVTSSNTDRMSFYIKTTGMNDLDPDDLPENNIHIGTYLCWHHEGSGGCPEEGPGNQHYYHWLTINSGGWIHVLLDQMPQHRRERQNGEDPVLNNPVKISDGKNYFEQLNQFYIEVKDFHDESSTMSLDEFEFYSVSDTEEPLQNDVSVSSLAVGYFPDTSHWEIGFMDNSFTTYAGDTQSTFQVRWSLSPITNSNWSSATPVDMEFYSGAEYTGKGDKSFFRRYSSYRRVVWNKFTINPSLLSGVEKVYFAVKDVSVEGGNKGTKWPYNSSDGRDSVSSYIKTIDYSLLGLKNAKALAKPPAAFNTKAITE